MHLISRFVLKQWLKSFISSAGVLLLLILAADFINALLQGYSSERIYYDFIVKMPSLFTKVIPITAMTATLFSLNNLKSHSELMAIMATSFNFKNFYYLFGVCALFISLFQFTLTGFIEPAMKKIRFENFKNDGKEAKLVARSTVGKSTLTWIKSKDYFSSFLYYDSTIKRIIEPTFYYINDQGILTKKIVSQYADHVNQKKWKLINLHTTQNLDKEEFSIAHKKEDLVVELNESEKDFSHFESNLETLNIVKYYKFIKSIEGKGVTIRESLLKVHDKISISLICLLFCFLPMTSLLTPNKRNSSFGKNVAYTVIIALSYWFLYSTLLSYGKGGKIPVLIAAYALPFILALYNFKTFRRLNNL